MMAEIVTVVIRNSFPLTRGTRHQPTKI